ncbi:MAG: nuclear transport factor 2 family protein [Gammaproteobacteria bacterium]|nr:nuclear transport factor 2 family protein [Gammaproteobacteria bacterium]
MTPAHFATPDAAEAAYYRAFERADYARMQSIWWDGEGVVCVHPLGPVLVGIDAVLASWRELFAGGPGLRFEVRLQGSIGSDALVVRTVAEIIRVSGESTPRPPIIASNGYRRVESGWRMVLHHASPTQEHLRPAARATAATTLH